MSCQENSREQDAATYESPSPETAGVIRGALRSIFRPTTLFRKGAAGKLPMQKVGKLSESASKGIDLVTNIKEAVSHEDSHNTTSASSNKNVFYNLGTKSIAFTKLFIKNTILGTAVFDCYVKLVEYGADMSGANDVGVVAAFADNNGNVPILSYHFFAGAVAGSVHSAVSLIFDSLEFRTLPSFQAARSSALHHSIAHSVLFGFYEVTKRRMVSYYSNVDNAYVDNYLRTEKKIVYFYEVASVALAGGIAGVLQTTVSHYTGMWLHIDGHTSNNNAAQQLEQHCNEKKEIISKLRSKIAYIKQCFQPLPPLRSTVILPFPIMAIAFLAFEFATTDSA